MNGIPLSRLFFGSSIALYVWLQFHSEKKRIHEITYEVVNFDDYPIIGFSCTFLRDKRMKISKCGKFFKSFPSGAVAHSKEINFYRSINLSQLK